MTSGFSHAPVLLRETLDGLDPHPGGRFIDCTIGGAGHAVKILERTRPDGLLLGLDADPLALRAAQLRLAPFGDSVRLVQTYFDRLTPVAEEAGMTDVDGILLDLGVSSPQLDQAQRGFSFQADAPLDMRFGPEAGQSAAAIVNEWPAAELARIFRAYGEERFAGRIARRIVETRREAPITTTLQLARVVASARPGHTERIHPATRVFQALRIAVNDELGRLERVLPQARDLLRPGGKLAVISFHSLEDRIVKHFIRQEAIDCICPPELPVCRCDHRATLRPVTRRPIEATAAEVADNPRARSARLRVAEKLQAS